MPAADDNDSFRSVRRPSGNFTVTGLWGEVHDGDTLSCCHCSYTWIVRKGSGAIRGWCEKCSGPHCGGPACWECVPVEQRVANIEKGIHPLTPRPTLVYVPELPPGE